MFNANLDQKLEQQKIKIRQLSIRIENIDLEINHFFNQLNISLDQLDTFAANKEHFSDENWEKFQEEKSKLSQKLELDLANIRNPLKTKKAMSSLKIQRHWIRVR